MGITPPSTWPWVDRPVSGLLPATSRPIKTRFPYGSPIRLTLPLRSNSLTHYTKGTPSPVTLMTLKKGGRPQCSRRGVNFKLPFGKLRSAPFFIKVTGSDCLYAYGFRFYFTPLSGVLFAFPSRYWFTIGRQGVFSLGGWSPHVQTG